MKIRLRLSEVAMKPIELRVPAACRASVGCLRLLDLALCALLTLVPSLLGQSPPNPVPFVNQPLVPTAVAPGGPDFTLTVNGTGFVPGATVNWSGSPRPTTFVSSSQLTAAIPATDITVIGTASVTVVNPAPGGGVSNTDLFLITFPIPSVAFTRTDFGTNGNARAATAADFNGDGKADLAVLRDYEVLIFLGNGDGTFQPERSFPTGGYSGSTYSGGILAADFNKDGETDLAVMNYYSSEDPAKGLISVLLGNSDGTFQPALSYPAPDFRPSAIVCADFNADGSVDLALTGLKASGAAVRIFVGSGNGIFLPGNEYPVVGASPYSLAVGDFDGDAVPDLAVPAYSYGDYNPLLVLLGNGDGTFRQLEPMTGGGISVVAADFNGDGKLDLAIGSVGYTSVSHSSVHIVRGVGDGTFQPAGWYSTGHAIGSPLDLAAADLNGDGKLDLVTPEGPLVVLWGNGDGTFLSSETYFTTDYWTISLAAADFDNDGRVDLAAGNYYSPLLSVFMQPSPVNLDPKTLAFGDHLLGTPENSLAATLTNSLTGPLTIPSIALTGDNAADFTETNDCPLSPATLAAGVSCTITVTFDHTTVGEKTAAVIVSDDAPGYPQQVLNLTGAVVNPTATLSSTSLDFGNQPIDVTSAAQTVTVSNSGVGTLTILGITVTGDFAVTNNCGTRLAQGAQCEVSVTFDPTNPGTRFGLVTITHNGATSPETISLSGTGVPPAITLSTTSLTFGDQHVWTSSPPQTVTLTNNGPGPLTVTSVPVTAEFSELDNCIGTVAASASCTISITFTPTANGTRTGTVTIYDNAIGSPQTVSLRGTGLGPVASLAPSNLSFPDQPVGMTSPPQTVTLTNSGAATMTLSGILATSPFAETTDCTAILSAGTSCTINVTFTPAVVGTTDGALRISDDAPGSPHTVALSGTGTHFALNVQPGGSTSATVNAGQTAAYNLQIEPGSGFSGDVALSCAFQGTSPRGASCSASPSSVALTGTNPAPFTVRVSTTARTLAAPNPFSPQGPHGSWVRHAVPLHSAWLIVLAMLLGIAGVAAAFRLARENPRLGLLTTPPTGTLVPGVVRAATLLAVLVWAACGGGGSAPPPPQDRGTPAGNYTLVLFATATGVTETLNLGLHVN